MIGDKAEIQSANDGTGNSGNIAIDLTDNLQLRNGADITTRAINGGGGEISIEADRFLSLSTGSLVTTSVSENAGNADNIDVKTSLLSVAGGGILAQAAAGRGGDNRIAEDDLVLSPNAIINAEAGEEGVDGTVQVTAQRLTSPAVWSCSTKRSCPDARRASEKRPCP